MTQYSRKKIIAQKSSTDLTSTNSRITNLENNEYKITYYEIISGASGSLTLPTGATINPGEFGLSGNCVLSKIDGSNKPTFESPKTSGGTVVTASLNETTGAWVASGTYTDSNVALIYSIKIKAIYYSNLTYNNIVETVELDGIAYVDAITYRKLHNYQNTDSTITGAAATETVVANLKVTGGVMGANGKLTFNFSAIKSGIASGFSFKAYVSTVATNVIGQTGAPTSATLVGQIVYGNTVVYGGVFSRSMANKNSASINYVYPVGVTNAAFDTAGTASARTQININTANDFWLVITCTMNSAADTGGLADLQIFIDKP